MSIEYVDHKMDEVYELIEQGEYLVAVNKIQQLKIKCPNDVLSDIKEWEDKKDKLFSEKIAEIEKTNMHPFDKNNKEYGITRDYAWDYYMYYNKLIREYDVK